MFADVVHPMKKKHVAWRRLSQTMFFFIMFLRDYVSQLDGEHLGMLDFRLGTGLMIQRKGSM